MTENYTIDFHKISSRRRQECKIAADFKLRYYIGCGYMGCSVNEIIETLEYPLRLKSSHPILLINNIGSSLELIRLFNKIKSGLIKKFPQLKFT